MLPRTITTIGVLFTCALVSVIYPPKEYVDIVHNAISNTNQVGDLDDVHGSTWSSSNENPQIVQSQLQTNQKISSGESSSSYDNSITHLLFSTDKYWYIRFAMEVVSFFAMTVLWKRFTARSKQDVSKCKKIVSAYNTSTEDKLLKLDSKVLQLNVKFQRCTHLFNVLANVVQQILMALTPAMRATILQTVDLSPLRGLADLQPVNQGGALKSRPPVHKVEAVSLDSTIDEVGMAQAVQSGAIHDLPENPLEAMLVQEKKKTIKYEQQVSSLQSELAVEKTSNTDYVAQYQALKLQFESLSTQYESQKQQMNDLQRNMDNQVEQLKMQYDLKLKHKDILLQQSKQSHAELSKRITDSKKKKASTLNPASQRAFPPRKITFDDSQHDDTLPDASQSLPTTPGNLRALVSPTTQGTATPLSNLDTSLESPARSLPQSPMLSPIQSKTATHLFSTRGGQLQTDSSTDGEGSPLRRSGSLDDILHLPPKKTAQHLYSVNPKVLQQDNQVVEAKMRQQEQLIHELQEQVESQASLIAELEGDNVELQHQVEVLQAQLNREKEQYDQTIEQTQEIYEREIANSLAKITQEYQQANQQLRQQVVELNTTVNKNAITITELNQQIERHKFQVSDLQAKNVEQQSQYNSQIATLQMQIQKLISAVTTFQSTSAQKQKQLEKQQQMLAELALKYKQLQQSQPYSSDIVVQQKNAQIAQLQAKLKLFEEQSSSVTNLLSSHLALPDNLEHDAQRAIESLQDPQQLDES